MTNVSVGKSNGDSERQSVGRGDVFWPHLFDPFRSFGHTLGTTVSNFFSPSAEAHQSTDKYTVAVELPGVKADDIDVSLHDNVLTIKGEKRSEREEKDAEKNTYFSERTYGAFQRSFRLPADVKADDIDAHFTDGVLTVSIPKVQEEVVKPRKINVNAR